MKQETRYSYEKRIKELKEYNEDLEQKLYSYKCTVMDIYDGVVTAVRNGNHLSCAWALERIRKCLK